MLWVYDNYTCCTLSVWESTSNVRFRRSPRRKNYGASVTHLGLISGTVLSLPLELFLGHGGKRDDQFYTGLMDDVRLVIINLVKAQYIILIS